MKRLALTHPLTVCVLLLCVWSVPVLAQQPVGTAANDANLDSGNVYVSIQNPKSGETYCVVKDGSIVATLSVVVTVGDFGAVMRVEPKEAAASVKKSDGVYLKRDVAHLERAVPTLAPPPRPYERAPAAASPTPLPPMVFASPTPLLAVPFTLPTPLPLVPFISATPQPPLPISSAAPPPSPPPSNVAVPFIMPTPPVEVSLITPVAPVPVATGLPPMEVETPKPITQDEAGIIIDNDEPNAVEQNPPLGWVHSLESSSSYGNSSLVTILTNSQVLRLTFFADINQDGNYEIYLWWVASSERYRSKRVPVTVHTADGDVKVTIDQTKGNAQWNSIGRYNLKAGKHLPIVTISNEEINKLDRGYISADAVKIVPRGPAAK